jgi:hypothetical protein
VQRTYWLVGSSVLVPFDQMLRELKKVW